MNIAIRYFSKFGHSAQMAEAVGQVAGVKAESVATPINEPVDTLYLGAGVMLGKISREMVDFINVWFALDRAPSYHPQCLR